MAVIPARGFDSATTPLASNPTLNLTAPSGEAGDLMVLGVLLASNQPRPEDLTVSLAQSGWVLAGETAGTGPAGVRHIVWYKTAETGSEPITVNFVGPSRVRAIASVARYTPHTVTAVKYRGVYGVFTPNHMLPGDAAWSDVSYLAVYTSGAGSSPTTIDPITLQNEHIFPTGVGGEVLRVAFASGTSIDAGQEESPGSNTYRFGNVGPVSSLPDESVVWALVLEPVRGVPSLDAPVTLHMSESLTGVFADPTVDATFFSLVDLPVGSPYSIGDQISGRTWYSGNIRDKSIQGGLTSYSLETLLAVLGRVTPRESLILVAGEGGVPNPLTLMECLVRFLDYYGVPYDPDIPEFYLRAGEELVIPTVPAFVIQPDQLNPDSIYAQLEPFYGVFRSYTFRADAQNRLVVSPPAWVDTLGLRLNLWRRRQENDRAPARQTAGAPWSTSRKPLVEWTASVDGVTYSGALPAPLELGAALQNINIGPVTVRIQWRSSDNRVQVSVWPPPPVDLTVGNLYTITFTLRPETLPGDEDELLELTVDDLDPDEVVTQSADTVINQAVIPVRARTFQAAQQIMQAGALVLASPGGVMPGLLSGNIPFGPMAEDLETPNGFLELVNDTVQEGAWFWPADETVVIQPGGNITVAYDVEEWAEQWRNASSPHAAAAQVNTYSDTVDLPANGAEVRLFDFQFPRQTTNFAPSPYGARGTVWGRWRAGENPGIELRVGNSHFVEFGYLPEMGIFGQTVYFLWGAIVKLNGTGSTFTVGDLHTYRFGFARGADGLWEDGANMPGLSESQALYPNRVYTAPELPYEVTPEVALAMARGIVEENLTPKVVHTLTIPPTRGDGYAVGPWHMGRAASVPALGMSGRVVSLDLSETHTAQAQGDASAVTVEVETTSAPPGSRAAATGYRRAAYGLSHYQQEG